jgi:RNA polymerase sigma factor (TIGR02999 family)
MSSAPAVSSFINPVVSPVDLIMIPLSDGGRSSSSESSESSESAASADDRREWTIFIVGSFSVFGYFFWRAGAGPDVGALELATLAGLACRRKQTLQWQQDAGLTASARRPEGHDTAMSGGEDGPEGTADGREALDDLYSATYEELRRLASSVARREANGGLSPTSLVNEAWLKLEKSPAFAFTSRLHFKRIAARAMRQVLVEAARRRQAAKRGGGGDALLVTFDESIADPVSCGDELVALDRALESLAEVDPRQALMVESRFFGGLDVAETAALLDVSEATILRDWRAAKAWLATELRQAR